MQGVIVCIGAALSWMAFDVDMGAFVALLHDLGGFSILHSHCALYGMVHCFTITDSLAVTVK